MPQISVWPDFLPIIGLEQENKQTKKNKTRSYRRPQTKGWRSLRSSDLASVILNMTLCRSEIPTSMSSSIPNSSPIAATENKLDSDVSRSRCMHTHNRACLFNSYCYLLFSLFLWQTLTGDIPFSRSQLKDEEIWVSVMKAFSQKQHCSDSPCLTLLCITA